MKSKIRRILRAIYQVVRSAGRSLWLRRPLTTRRQLAILEVKYVELSSDLLQRIAATERLIEKVSKDLDRQMQSSR